MKKTISVILLLTTACLLLSGCLVRAADPEEMAAITTKATKTTSTTAASSSATASVTTTPEPTTFTTTAVPVSAAEAPTHGESMVSDGEYIYFCPTEPIYDYRNHFGTDRSMKDSFVCALWRVPVEDALTDPLNRAEILVDQNCRWLCIHDGFVYYVNTDDNAIYRITRDSLTVERVCGADDFGPASAGSEDQFLNIRFIDDSLYFFQFSVLKRIDPDVGASSVENVFNVFRDDSDYRYFCESVDLDPSGDVYIDLRSYESFGGDIYLTVRCSDDYFEESCALLRIDPDDFAYEIVCADVSPDLALCGGKLYYQEECGESMFGDPLLRLMAFDGTSSADTGVVTDSRGLFTDGEKLYYDNYVDTTEAYFAYLDGLGEEPEYGWVNDRLLFTYDGTAGEQLLPMDSSIMYINGVAGNVLWYEYFADHIWMATDGTASASMATKYVRDDSEYGPGTSSLDLDTTDLSACFRLIRTDGEEEFRVFLNPHESRTMTFPCGKYILKIAEGETWISDTEAFGAGGDYSTTDYFNFEAGSSYYIGSGTRGDFRGDNASGFLN